ncbi:MAG: 3-hydroxy-2-methylbutyryl-CoA dehydrogenase [Microbacteriaceae bacterium]|nr:3-hydroxy-2-methylbutyryl-CoA dehydrogenase [Microbacteriaceae bacterium]
MEIAGTVALVTGGASGLGFATATALRAAGAEVVIVDLVNSDGVARAAGLGATFVPADVADPAQMQAAVEKAVALGPLRIVVCCAGIATPGKVVGKAGPLPLEDFERVVRVNLTGTFNTIRLASAAMQAMGPVDGDSAGEDSAGEERGVIVMTASVAAFDGQIGQPAYAASKAGVAGMTLPIARELASSRIRVMTIAPGIFQTPMLAGLPQAAQDSLGAQVPHPSRLGKPDEYAALVEHIVRNPMLNGETIRLDGAIRMAPR